MGQKSVLFRCDGYREIGLGHVVRCLALADELRLEHHIPCAFAMRHSPLAFDMVMQKGYSVLTPQAELNDDVCSLPCLAGEQSVDSIRAATGGRPSIRWLERAIRQVEAGALILDVRSEPDDLPRQVVDAWRSQGVLIVTVDDPGERRLSADMAFYPPVPQVKRLDWSGFTGQLYVGWEWIVLRREFSHCPADRRNAPHLPEGTAAENKSPRPQGRGETGNRFGKAPGGRVRGHVQPPERPVVLVTMGGSDPAGLTLKAVEALDLMDEDFESVLVLGPAFPHHEALKRLIAGARRSFTLRVCAADMPGLMTHDFGGAEHPPTLASLMAQADLALVSFGVTAYELASLGVPAIYLCLTEDHAESASMLVEAGLGKSLGVASRVSEKILAEAVRDSLARIVCGEQPAPERPIDGRGAERIALIVAGRMRA